MGERKRGAPKKPADEKHDERLEVYLNTYLRSTLRSMAAEKGLASGTYARMLLVEAMEDRRKNNDEGYQTS